MIGIALVGADRDMMIHDFDMARWILGEEPVSIYSCGSCRGSLSWIAK
jgi:predicted dehydrogenase